MVKATVFGDVDSGSIQSRVKPITLKLVFTASLLDPQQKRNSVENKPASLDLLVPLGKVSDVNLFFAFVFFLKNVFFCKKT